MGNNKKKGRWVMTEEREQKLRQMADSVGVVLVARFMAMVGLPVAFFVAAWFLNYFTERMDTMTAAQVSIAIDIAEIRTSRETSTMRLGMLERELQSLRDWRERVTEGR